jgi:hypothetical protein
MKVTTGAVFLSVVEEDFDGGKIERSGWFIGTRAFIFAMIYEQNRNCRNFKAAGWRIGSFNQSTSGPV